VLAVMGGAVVFTGALLPQLDFPLDFDYLHVTRYGDVTVGGRLHWVVEPRRRWPGAACWWSTTSSTRA
jgi:hypoxanthine phosphoribosyltransferase